MKVLMTADTIGGVWTYAVDLIKALSKFNVHVLLATMGKLPDRSQIDSIRSLPNATLRCSSYKLEWMEDPGSDLNDAQRWIIQLAHDFTPDIIHFNSYAFHGSLFNVPVIMVGHSCVLSWWKSVKNEVAPSGWNAYSEIVRTGLQSANMVVAPSETMMNALNEHYGTFRSWKVIYNGRDPELFYTGKKKKFVFSMGRLWDEAKNISLLAEAAKHINYPVYIAGPYGKETNTEQYNNIHFLGKLTPQEIACWLSEAMIYVSPALYEPFGLSVLEAAYSGCTLLLANISSLIEIWEDNALYFDMRSPKALAQQINKIMDDESLLQFFARKAGERAKEFDNYRMAKNYFKIYRSLLEDTDFSFTTRKLNFIKHENLSFLP